MTEMREVQTKWKRFSPKRLRQCIDCGRLFPSANPEERRCAKCTKSMEDARARAYTVSDEAELKLFIDEHFNYDLVDRRDRSRKIDNEAREERRRLLGG
jgi:hypothetical protein